MPGLGAGASPDTDGETYEQGEPAPMWVIVLRMRFAPGLPL